MLETSGQYPNNQHKLEYRRTCFRNIDRVLEDKECEEEYCQKDDPVDDASGEHGLN